ncbi:MAG: hypothetical protein OEV42_18725 [Deltaproteobacteria bacterium]|nr:hypothetical protein [Deltaproteobacteria bacterium]
MKEFKEILEEFEKGESAFDLTDYFILGEDLSIIKALGEQLTLYSDITGQNGPYHKGMNIEISIDALSGLGKAIIKIAELINKKIEIIDKRFPLKSREEKRS